MMRRRIRTADEEMNGILFTIAFTVLWYGTLIHSILLSGFHAGLMIFLVAGIMVPAQAVRTVQKALYHRRFHKQCMNECYPQKGRIVNITREYYDTYDSRDRRRRITYYFLIIEIVNVETGAMQRIKSSPYRMPIHKYLASPYVQVYTDKTGWKYVIDGFELKKNRNEPDIPLEDSNVYLKDFNQPTAFVKIIFIAVLVLMILQSMGILH